ncbi:hypothetical protein L292_1217 [Acinetobacter junii CIP 107470 = MTCC 11364]|uniref:Uncharacterized protein n=1 Tax=Acinetobacter junii CIP 107470 = MTCC 11364 TaxID=1217666 RepID=S7XPX6_ACIJU|nr:hypothetical protein L292_1217 [Acinetobacter junii CIP 107470 = MTCC 11364]
MNKHPISYVNAYDFLSCLYGSELLCKPKTKTVKFLSCLYGSERLIHYQLFHTLFLSCLYGSEPSASVCPFKI